MIGKNGGRAIKALGEVALRVSNINPMHDFYEDVVGLELLKGSSSPRSSD